MSGVFPLPGAGVGSDVGLDELAMPPDSLIHIKADGKGESILDVVGALPLLSQGTTTKPAYGRVIIPGVGTPFIVRASGGETGRIFEIQDSGSVFKAGTAFNGHQFATVYCFENNAQVITRSGANHALNAGAGGNAQLITDFGTVSFGGVTGFFQIPFAMVMDEAAVGPSLGAGSGGYWTLTGTPTTPQFTDSANADHPLAMTNVATTWTQDHIFQGNVTIQGDTITATAETLLADNHILLNAGYTSDPAQTCGLIANFDPTVTTDTVAAGGFTAGVPSTSNPIVITAGSATFAAGDIVQFDTTNDPANNGIREVLSHVGTTLTIRGIGVTARVEDFTQNQFVTDATVAGGITKVNVSVLRAGLDGKWETAKGSTTGFAFLDLVKTTGLTQGSIPFADSSGDLGQDNTKLFWDNTLKRFGSGTNTPNAPMEVAGSLPGIVGGSQSGILHVTVSSADVNASAVITGHNLFGGNKQLWYLGSTSSSNDNIGLINRQNGSTALYTNSIPRLTVEADGDVTLEQTIKIKGGAPAAGRLLTSVDGTGAATWEEPVGGGVTLFGVSTATQSFTNNTTLADVTSLSVAIAANEKMHVKIVLYTSTGIGGLKLALNGPAGFTSLHYIVQATKTTGVGTAGQHTAYNSSTGESSSTLIAMELHAIIINGETAGNIVARAAQNSSNASASDILRDSFISGDVIP